jgi:hypothetical protein
VGGVVQALPSLQAAPDAAGAILPVELPDKRTLESLYTAQEKSILVEEGLL